METSLQIAMASREGEETHPSSPRPVSLNRSPKSSFMESNASTFLFVPQYQRTLMVNKMPVNSQAKANQPMPMHICYRETGQLHTRNTERLQVHGAITSCAGQVIICRYRCISSAYVPLRVDHQSSPDRAMGNQPPCKNLFRVADRKDTSMSPKMIKKIRAVKMLCFQITRMPIVISIVVINITNVTATPAAPALDTLSQRFHEAEAEGSR